MNVPREIALNECRSSLSLLWPLHTPIQRFDAVFSALLYGAFLQVNVQAFLAKLVYIGLAWRSRKNASGHSVVFDGGIRCVLQMLTLAYYLLSLVAHGVGIVFHISCFIPYVPSYSLFAIPYQMTNSVFVSVNMMLLARFFSICQKNMNQWTSFSRLEYGLLVYTALSPVFTTVMVAATHNDAVLMWSLYLFKLSVEVCAMMTLSCVSIYFYVQLAGAIPSDGTRILLRNTLIRCLSGLVPLILDLMMNKIFVKGLGIIPPIWIFRITDYLQIIICSTMLCPSKLPSFFSVSVESTGNRNRWQTVVTNAR